MKVLLDHNVDRRLRRHLPGHDIKTTREMGWEALANGALLKSAAAGGFNAFVSADKKLEHEQNLRTLPLPILVIDARSNALPALLPFAPHIIGVLASPLEPLLYVLEPDGNVIRLTAPRP